MHLARRLPIVGLAALLALAAAAAPEPAQAQSCPLFSYFTTSPAYPTDDAPTSVTLFGCFPCAEVVSTQILTGTQVEVVLRSNAPCKDTVHVWQATFDFGVLAAGSHNLIITVRDEANPQVGEMFGQWFTVGGDPGPPPPPPPPLPPAPNGPLFLGIITHPSPATTAAPTYVTAYGTSPTWCGFVSHFRFLEPDHVTFTLRQLPGCTGDSANFKPDSIWTQEFGLGVLKPGRHEVRMTIYDATGADSLTGHDFTAAFDVIDAGAPPPPPPPPPPIDSLVAPTPNPFAQQTKVEVIVNEETDVDVSIFDAAGRRVKTIYKGPIAAGTRSYSWDGRRESGERARPGVYFYRVLQPGKTWARRVVLLPQR